MQDYRKLQIYQLSIEYCGEIYKFSSNFPSEEKFGLTSQIRRAVTSVALNISEGAGTTTQKEFAHFISYAYRSCNEVLTCLELVNYLSLAGDKKSLDDLASKGRLLSKKIYTFLSKLK